MNRTFPDREVGQRRISKALALPFLVENSGLLARKRVCALRSDGNCGMAVRWDGKLRGGSETLALTAWLIVQLRGCVDQ